LTCVVFAVIVGAASTWSHSGTHTWWRWLAAQCRFGNPGLPCFWPADMGVGGASGTKLCLGAGSVRVSSLTCALIGLVDMIVGATTTWVQPVTWWKCLSGGSMPGTWCFAVLLASPSSSPEAGVHSCKLLRGARSVGVIFDR
jgi:hypothetical protein